MRMLSGALRCCFTLCFVLLLAGCAVAPTHPSLSANADLPALVPVRQYVADWDGNGGHQISPDGKQLMWGARKGLGPGLFVKNLETGAVHSYAIPVPGQWAQDSRHVLLHLDNGNENSHVFELDAFSPDGQLKDLTPFAGAKSFIQTQIRGSADLLIASNRRDPRVYDLYRHEQATGELKLIVQNPGSVALWLADKAAQVVGRARLQGDEWIYEVPLDPGNMQWREAFRLSYFDAVKPLEVSADGHFLWALSNRGRDKLALVKLDLRNGAEQVVHADARVDISHALISARTGEPLAVSLDPDNQEWVFFDARLQAAADRLRAGQRSRLELLGLSRDENWLVASVVGEAGGQNLLVDLATGRTTVLGQHTRSRLQALSPLPRQQGLSFNARDGLPLHGYLTLPPGRAGKPLPTVVYVHGGPWARDLALSGDTMPLFLANRGYAVLQVNYRGSSGYGRAFTQAAKGEFAAGMHSDLLDGLDTLVAQGITDPHKVAIMGASYGGYASLVGMTFTPERFACGISLFGMSDLASLLENAPPYWELNKPWWMAYVGDPAKPEERAVMDTRSPLRRAAQVQGPLLLLHGALDARVKVDQSMRMAQALRNAGKAVDLHVYARAGHGLHRWPDRLDYFRRTEDFLAQCLGGRSSGFDFYQLGSWAL